MPVPAVRLTVLLLAVFLSPCLLCAGEAAQVLPIGGDAYRAELVSVSDDWTVTLKRGEKSATIAVKDLVVWGAPGDPKQAQRLLLPGGDLLVAEVVETKGDNLTVDSALFGTLSVPLTALTGIVFHPPADDQRSDALAFRVRDAKGDVDRLILDNGDELSGTVLSVSSAEVELESNVGKVKIETDRIAALAFNPTLVDRPRAEGLRAIAGFDDGSRLTARQLTVASQKLELQTAAGVKLAGDSSHLVFLQPLGGRATYLSDLKPSGYRHIPMLDLPWRHQADRNVLGSRLRAGGKLYLKGIGMHSASRLSFPLDGQRRFAAELAIDDAAAGQGSVVFRVFVDAQQKYVSPIIRGGSPPVPVSLELPADGRSLSLIVDFAERGDTLDYANWLNARLEE